MLVQQNILVNILLYQHKQEHLGYFDTPQEAFAVYKPFKENLCKQLALKWQTEIDERLFNAMMNWTVNYEA